MIPDRHTHHDNVGFTADKDGFVSIEVDDDEIVRGILEGTKTEFKIVLTPKKLHQLGRFLGKVGLGLLATSDPARARDQRFDQVRRYARYGDFNELWPIFHYAQGRFEDFRPTVVTTGDKKELQQVQSYSYGLLEMEETYTLFRFNMGIDNWVMCLDDPFPHPVIREAFPGMDLRLIWYEEKQWKTASSRD